MTRRIILWGGGSADLIDDIAKPILGDGTDVPWGWFPIWDFQTPPTELKPNDVLVAMGKAAITHLSAEKTWAGMAKNAGVETLRSRIGKYKDASAMVTYDPSMVNMDAGARSQIRWDLRLARRFIATNSLEPVIGRYRWVTLDQFIALINDFIARRCVVALDLETMGFYPQYPDKKIITYQITDRAGAGFVLHHSVIPPDRKPELIDALQRLLNDKGVKLRGANLKFDLNWLWWKYGLECTNFSFDTMLVGSMLDENRSNSLEWHAKEHTDMGGYDTAFNQKYDKGRMDLVPVNDTFLTYAAGDVDSCHQVSDFQIKQLKIQPSLSRLYSEVVHPAARVFEKIEQRGVLVSPERYDALRADLENDIAHSHAAALKHLPARLKAKHAGKLDLSRGELVAEYLFDKNMGLGLQPKMWTEKKGAPSTAAKHLKMFMDDPEGDAVPFLTEYRKYVSSSKVLSTYVTGFLQHLRPGNRFHATYLLFNGSAYESDDDDSGTVTGRLAALDPAMQCMVPETIVLTSKGPRELGHIVQAYESGQRFKVLTHTGHWRDVVGVYRNGIKRVYDVFFASGAKITCTGNHPILTQRGWVKTEELKPGDFGHVARASDQELHEPNLLLVDRDEEPLSITDIERLAALRGQGNKGLQTLAELREIPGRHGGEAGDRLVYRTFERERELHTEELRVGATTNAGIKPPQFEEDHVSRRDANRGRVGEARGYFARTVALQAYEARPQHEGRNEERAPAEPSLFKLDRIVNVVERSEQRETFDLTIDRSHSFIANGVVVHNTVPKHPKLGQSKYWAKELRKCFIAPPGMVMWEADFSQGELRVVACVASEATMLSAYMKGMDLHCLSGSQMANVPYDEFICYEAHKDSTDAKEKALFALYKEFRQKAKSANFGLLYGMGAEGFQAYARDSYGVLITLAEAEKIHATFFQTYPGLLDYHNRMKSFAYNRGFVQSPLGRIRRLPLIRSKDSYTAGRQKRQAINSPIQGCLSDLCLFAIVEIEKQLAAKGVQLVGMIHDAIIGYMPAEKATELALEIQGIMSNLPIKERLGWDHQLTFPADIEYGDDWASLKKITVS